MVASGEFMSIMKPPRVSVPRTVRNRKGNLRKKVLKKPGLVSQLLHSKLLKLLLSNLYGNISRSSGNSTTQQFAALPSLLLYTGGT